MPICICPECSKSHKIPAKNLGLKGRCTQCRAIFELIEQPPTPPPPPVVVAPPEPDPEPAFEPETFSLRPPVPAAPPLVAPAESASDDEWLEDLDFDDAQPADREKPRKSGARGEVASLPRRPALTIIATVYTVVGCLFLLGVIATVVVSVLVLSRAGTPQQSAMAATFVASMVPVFVACIMGAVSCIAFGEAIHWGIAVEARLHEISKNQSR